MIATNLHAKHSIGVNARTVYTGHYNGIAVEAAEWFCEGSSRFDLTRGNYRVGIVLEQSGGRCETRTSARAIGEYRHGRPFASLSSPGLELWACSEDIRYARSLSLEFDASALAARLGDTFEARRSITPRLNFEHAELGTLAELLARDCRAPSPFSELYSESLVDAMLVQIVRLQSQGNKQQQKSRLRPWQLRRAIEIMESRVDGRVRLSELARATNLSPAHFSRAFKASTGMPPYHWHLHSRITRAQQLLLDGQWSIAEIAAATGFADQAHLTRVFHRLTGMTPSSWQRERRR
jgi:AraC family transcriptional regulator